MPILSFVDIHTLLFFFCKHINTKTINKAAAPDETTIYEAKRLRKSHKFDRFGWERYCHLPQNDVSYALFIALASSIDVKTQRGGGRGGGRSGRRGKNGAWAVVAIGDKGEKEGVYTGGSKT